MAQSCCQTIKALNNSILTFECIAKLSNDRPDNFNYLRFEDVIEDGLEIFPIADFQTYLEISYSTNCGGTYTNITPAGATYNTNPQYPDPTLRINIAEDDIPESTDYDYTLVRVKFPVFIEDIEALNCKVINTGRFNMQSDTSPTTIIGEPAYVKLCDSTLEKYDFTVAGYSLNVCGDSCSSCLECLSSCTSPCVGSTTCTDKFNEDFTAAFLFNAINGDYGVYNAAATPTFENTGEYVITIPSVNGVNFPTADCDLEKVKVSLASGCLCHGTDIDDVEVTTSRNGGSLVITIPHTGTDDFETCDMGGKFILVTIPYEIDDCTESPVSITGSIEFRDTTDPATDPALASLDNFCLCVNTECSGLSGVSKTILC